MMKKIQLAHLDIPIIRACNLACVGCITHSDHKNIKGVVRLEESLDWLKFWADRTECESVTLFGGEPLLHPEFADWAVAIKTLWGSGVSVNTNGYYIENLYSKIPELFTDAVGLNMVVSFQTAQEPYLSKVKNSVDTLKQLVVDYHLSQPGVTTAEWKLWLDEIDINSKQWFVLLVNGTNTGIGITTCEQHKIPWTNHYTGLGETMRPVYSFYDNYYTQNHQYCQARSFVTLYRGRMYKCPPIGVLNHTLNTFGLTDHFEWEPYLANYHTVGPESTDDEIVKWFDNQKNPEQICNMCGYVGPKSGWDMSKQQLILRDRNHTLKNYWNYKL